MSRTTTIKFDSPVRDAIEQFAKAGAALPNLKAESGDRPGAAKSERVGASVAEFIPYGPPLQDGSASCEILATLGEIELEYAAIRRSAAIFDAPHRGTLIISGGERRDFLNRMLTQDLRSLPAGAVAAAFWLNRKGRIDADLLLAELGEEIIIDLDVTTAEATAKALDSFVFGEDVQVRDSTSELQRIQVHGPAALDLVQHALGVGAHNSKHGTGRSDDLTHPPTPSLPGRGSEGASEPARGGMPNHSAVTINYCGAPITIIRHDIAGEPGLHLTMQREHVERCWHALVDAQARPIGWYALNIARIEAGTPIFNIDFGPNNLPHETAIVDQRVSFKKGCYIGQEIVARMQNLGAPKQKLTGLSMKSDHLPVAGAAVFEIAEDKPGDRIGVVTSSTISPMCSAQPIAFAMLRTQHTAPGSAVIVHAEGEEARAEAHALTFWSGEGTRA
jgi:folate-binding protein YgfZ